MKNINSIPVFSFFHGVIKSNPTVPIGNVAAVISLNLYFEKYWIPIIFLIFTLFFFSSCMFLFYKFKNKKSTNDEYLDFTNKSRDVFKTVLLSLIMFLIPYTFNLYVEWKRVDKMITENVKWENSIKKINSIVGKLKNGEINIRNDKIKQGDIHYLNAYALYYCNERIHHNKGFEYFTIAANKGDAFAWNQLAWMYSKGINTAVNNMKAIECFKKSADLGYVESMYSLGAMYSRGIGVEKKIDLAFKYYTDAALCGNVNAMLNLGQLYAFNEKGKKWEYWYKKAAEKGCKKAYGFVASILLEEGNYEKAKEFAVKAIDNFDYSGYVVLADLYNYGFGVTKNIKYAETLYKECVYLTNSSNSMMVLAAFYKENNNLSQYNRWVKEAERKDSLDGIKIESIKKVENNIEIVRYNHHETKSF